LLSVAESLPKRDGEEFTLTVTGLIKNLQYGDQRMAATASIPTSISRNKLPVVFKQESQIFQLTNNVLEVSIQELQSLLKAKVKSDRRFNVLRLNTISARQLSVCTLWHY
jgi:hypothetical protein